MRNVCIVLAFCVAAVMVSAQTFTNVANFNGTDGLAVWNPLSQATNGNLYGAANQGGTNGRGTVFEYDPLTGQLTSVYSFCAETNCADGSQPNGGLVQATNGDLYGTTSYGGGNCQDQEELGCGTVFKVSPAGSVSTVYSFCSQANCADGAYPMAGLVQASNGNLYGTTYKGGDAGAGTIFEITPKGKLAVLYSFCSQTNCTDGEYPVTPLIQAAGGLLYGTTAWGGTANDGTTFQITEKGKLTTLHSFDGTDGQLLEAGLVRASNKKFYGATVYGGLHGKGTVFEMTAAGVINTLHSFCSQTDCTDGETPQAGLIQGPNGNLYGTTSEGGANNSDFYCNSQGCGTIFEITSKGKFSSLYSFCSQANCTDGATPQAALVQATDGSLYGPTTSGGTYVSGSLFSLTFNLSTGKN